MALKSDIVKDFTYRATKILILGRDGETMASSSNPVPVDAIVNVDTMNISAEMKVDSGHDLYLATTVARTADLAVSFDIISGLTITEIQSVENKTQGWIYTTKGAIVTSTTITLVAANQKLGYPVIGVSDVVEIVYRGTSRLTNGSQRSISIGDMIGVDWDEADFTLDVVTKAVDKIEYSKSSSVVRTLDFTYDVDGDVTKIVRS